ncbi:MAG: methyl-accepting chemotaxis protein, partial [Ignavibacteriales bacterium]|nr:methyl-accepting chemotaxis protein [Ignavibacteriales bacterium]
MDFLKALDNWKLINKVVLIAFVALFPVLLLMFVYVLPRVSDFSFHLKEESVRFPVDAAYSLIEHYNTKVKSGELTLDAAQKAVLAEIEHIRFDKTNYIWIHSTDNKMIMHPIKKELNGTDVSNSKDPDGKRLFIDMTNIVKEKGEGVYNYLWSKPGSEKPVPKISSIKLFAEWGWVIGAGAYVDDIEEAVSGLRNPIIFYLILIVLISVILSYLIAKRIASTMQLLTNDADNIALGDATLRTYKARKDELGALQESFTKMSESIRQQSSVAESIAQGDVHVKVVQRSDKDTLSISMQKMINTIGDLVQETKKLTAYAVNGELSKRGDETRFLGAYKDIVMGVNQTLEAMINPVQIGSKALGFLAQGDLTARVLEDFKGDHKLIKESINAVASSLSQTIREVQNAVQAT